MKLLIWNVIPETFCLETVLARISSEWRVYSVSCGYSQAWISWFTEMFWGSAGQRGSVGLLRCWSLTVSPKTLTPTRCPLHTPRSLSFSAPLKSPAHEAVKQPLRRWDLSVSPFTTVRAQIGCNISIHPLDPHTYPEADRAFITVHGPDKEQEVSVDRLKVHYDDRSKELLISAETVDSDVSIEMSAPLKSSECVYDRGSTLKWFCALRLWIISVCEILSDLFITTQGKGSVQVKNMECDICKVRTEKGNCLLHSVKVGIGNTCQACN